MGKTTTQNTNKGDCKQQENRVAQGGSETVDVVQDRLKGIGLKRGLTENILPLTYQHTEHSKVRYLSPRGTKEKNVLWIC